MESRVTKMRNINVTHPGGPEVEEQVLGEDRHGGGGDIERAREGLVETWHAISTL